MLERYERVVDLGVFGIANLINLLLVVIFLTRARTGTRDTPVENVAGWITVAMALPLIAAIILNIAAKRGAWLWILPLVTVVYLIVEFVLDYALKIDFRSTGLLAPYLILYYLAQFAMVGCLYGGQALRLYHTDYVFCQPSGDLLFICAGRARMKELE